MPYHFDENEQNREVKEAISKGASEIELKVRDAIKANRPDQVGLIRLANCCEFVPFGVRAFTCSSKASFQAKDRKYYCDVHAVTVATKILEGERDAVNHSNGSGRTVPFVRL